MRAKELLSDRQRLRGLIAQVPALVNDFLGKAAAVDNRIVSWYGMCTISVLPKGGNMIPAMVDSPVPPVLPLNRS